MSDNMLREALENTRDHLAELWVAIDHAERMCQDGEDNDPRSELDERPLEIVWQAGSPFSVLLTFGGPNIWIECDARFDHYVLKGAWGGDTDELTDPWSDDAAKPITRTGEYFRELVDEGDES